MWFFLFYLALTTAAVVTPVVTSCTNISGITLRQLLCTRHHPPANCTAMQHTMELANSAMVHWCFDPDEPHEPICTLPAGWGLPLCTTQHLPDVILDPLALTRYQVWKMEKAIQREIRQMERFHGSTSSRPKPNGCAWHSMVMAALGDSHLQQEIQANLSVFIRQARNIRQDVCASFEWSQLRQRVTAWSQFTQALTQHDYSLKRLHHLFLQRHDPAAYRTRLQQALVSPPEEADPEWLVPALASSVGMELERLWQLAEGNNERARDALFAHLPMPQSRAEKEQLVQRLLHVPHSGQMLARVLWDRSHYVTSWRVRDELLDREPLYRGDTPNPWMERWFIDGHIPSVPDSFVPLTLDQRAAELFTAATHGSCEAARWYLRVEVEPDTTRPQDLVVAARAHLQERSSSMIRRTGWIMDGVIHSGCHEELERYLLPGPRDKLEWKLAKWPRLTSWEQRNVQRQVESDPTLSRNMSLLQQVFDGAPPLWLAARAGSQKARHKMVRAANHPDATAVWKLLWAWHDALEDM